MPAIAGLPFPPAPASQFFSADVAKWRMHGTLKALCLSSRKEAAEDSDFSTPYRGVSMENETRRFGIRCSTRCAECRLESTVKGGRGEIGRRSRLLKLECPQGNLRSRTAQSRGTLTGYAPQANPEPSPFRGEGVETGRAAPKAFGSWRRDSPAHERHMAAAKAEVG